jgi:choline dehydrogenase-like flavoprotein
MPMHSATSCDPASAQAHGLGPDSIRFWTEERVTGGADPVELGSNNSGRGVGGSTVHYSMIALRMHADDFRRRTLEGALAGDDLQHWPLSYEDLEPYYARMADRVRYMGGEGCAVNPRLPNPGRRHAFQD